MLRSVHHKGYPPPPIRRVCIPKPGKKEKRPLGVPCVADRALHRSVCEVLSAIYEQDFLPCSFGGRRGLGAPNALGTLTEVIAGKKVGHPTVHKRSSGLPGHKKSPENDSIIRGLKWLPGQNSNL